jgi:hypothetical protein
MINSETPHKLADIIRDTWPNLYRSPSDQNLRANMQKLHMDSEYDRLHCNGYIDYS